MAEREIYLTKDVFVAGAAPEVTYNPRSERHQEQELERYLDQGPGRALTVSGPTKSGKTVLVERRLDRDVAIWIEGPDLTDVSIFWHRVVDWLGLYDLVEVGRAEDEGAGRQMGLSVGSANVAKIDASKSDSTRTSTSVRKSRTTDITAVARKGLEDWRTPIVIDDFHSVAEDVKVPIARAIKTVILHTKVVLIAVPHEAFEVVRREPDMGFRVERLEINAWSQKELEFIAERGFDALAIDDRHGVGGKLASASYGAPFLMQQLCYDYVRYILNVEQTPAAGRIQSVEPDSWLEFFTGIADRTPADIFTSLLKGPKERGTRRQVRVFHDGSTTDIYGSLLHAVAEAGKLEVSLVEISEILERGLVEPPARQRISLSLGHMSSIAKKQRGTGDPAVDFKDETLNILDPFLLFYLRYGTYSLMKDMTTPDPNQIELDTEVETADPEDRSDRNDQLGPSV
jgi:hypothetical protein